MGSIWVTLAIFIFALVVFHFLMFMYWKTLRCWQILEYVWLFVGVFGLLGTTIEARIFLEKNMIWLYQNHYNSALERAIRTAADEEILCNRAFSSNEKLTEQYQQASLWFANKKKMLLRFKENPNSVKWKELLPSKTNETVGAIRASKEFFRSDIDILRKATENLDEHNAKMSFDGWPAVLKVFSPWLIATALALRITKTSAFFKYSKTWP